MVGLCAVAACKSQSGDVHTDPNLSASLDSCKQALEDNQRVRKDLEAQLKDGGVVIKIEGELLKITGKGPNAQAEAPAVGDAKDEELYQKFIASVKRSRSAIENCYRRALKNDSSLQARTISVSVNVDYATSGAVKSTATSPRISDSFNSCIEGVTKNWTLPAMPKAASFRAPLTLTPES